MSDVAIDTDVASRLQKGTEPAWVRGLRWSCRSRSGRAAEHRAGLDGEVQAVQRTSIPVGLDQSLRLDGEVSDHPHILLWVAPSRLAPGRRSSDLYP